MAIFDTLIGVNFVIKSIMLIHLKYQHLPFVNTVSIVNFLVEAMKILEGKKMSESGTAKLSKSEVAKQKWKDCEYIANLLSSDSQTITKNQVHDHLFTEIKQADILDNLLSGNENIQMVSVGIVKTLPGWNRMLNQPTPKVYSPRKSDDPLEDTNAELRVALWYLNKFSSDERALTVLKVAIKAREGLG